MSSSQPGALRRRILSLAAAATASIAAAVAIVAFVVPGGRRPLDGGEARPTNSVSAGPIRTPSPDVSKGLPSASVSPSASLPPVSPSSVTPSTSRPPRTINGVSVVEQAPAVPGPQDRPGSVPMDLERPDGSRVPQYNVDDVGGGGIVQTGKINVPPSKSGQAIRTVVTMGSVSIPVGGALVFDFAGRPGEIIQSAEVDQVRDVRLRLRIERGEEGYRAVVSGTRTDITDREGKRPSFVVPLDLGKDYETRRQLTVSINAEHGIRINGIDPTNQGQAFVIRKHEGVDYRPTVALAFSASATGGASWGNGSIYNQPVLDPIFAPARLGTPEPTAANVTTVGLTATAASGSFAPVAQNAVLSGGRGGLTG